MTFKEHCTRCKNILGNEFDYVHKWLDEFHGTPKYKTRHRKVRHHLKGIEDVRDMWGDDAAEAATLHIVDDLKVGEDISADESWIAKNEKHYVELGYW